MSLIVCIRNISSLAEVSDYEYWVRVGDGSPERSKTLASGEIKGHKRSDGWQALVNRVLKENHG
jgi:hypothetical protein